MGMGRKGRALACGAGLLASAAVSGGGFEAAHPVVEGFDVDVDTGTDRLLGMTAPVAGTTSRVGFLLRCEKAAGTLEVTTSFLGYPPGVAVQARVTTPDGTEHRFGRRELGGVRSGFHSPVVSAPERVVRFVDAMLRSGSTLSNGSRGVRNGATGAENARVREELARCATTLSGG